MVTTKLRAFLKLGCVAIAATIGASEAAAQVAAQAYWNADGAAGLTATCQSLQGVSQCPQTAPVIVPIRSGASPDFFSSGRSHSALKVSAANQGYITEIAPDYSSAVGFAWMGFVWIDEFQPGVPQAILWNEGWDFLSRRYITGLTIAVRDSGEIGVSIGRNGSWVGRLYSRNKIGVKAWHHVALVWDGQAYFLMLDGILQSTLGSTFPPDEAPSIPTTIGSYYRRGKPKFVLNGAIDELKLVKFSIGSFSATSPSQNFVLGEHGLLFRKTILDDMIAAGHLSSENTDIFASPTFQATSMLRAWINSFYTLDRLSLPQDSLNLSSGSFADYAFPVLGQDNVPTTANSLYLRIKAPQSDPGARLTYCGGSAITLWAAFKAFGFAAHYHDWMNADDLSYTDSHVVTEVYTVDTAIPGKYVMQDPTWNLSGYSSTTGTYSGVLDIHDAAGLAPTTLPFDNAGYNYNVNPILPPTPTAEQYFGYFGSPATIWNSWIQ